MVGVWGGVRSGGVRGEGVRGEGVRSGGVRGEGVRGGESSVSDDARMDREYGSVVMCQSQHSSLNNDTVLSSCAVVELNIRIIV